MLDALSRDDDRSNEELTSVIKSFCPSQVPSHFKILQLPKEIISWLTALLLKLPVSAQLSKVHTRSKIGHGASGKNTSFQLESKTISFLENFSREHRHIIIGAFAMAVKESRFSRASHEQLAADTVKDTMQYVCTTFQENGYQNPFIDDDGQPAFILQQEFRSFKNTDPEEKHQKAIPMSVISELIRRDSTKLKQATGELATVRIFFAMRSCKYLKVAKPDQQRTEILRMRNVRFFQGTEQLGHDHRELEFADCIALTFKRQKKEEKIDMVTLMASQDAHLCPVRGAAAIVRRIRKYPGSSQDSPISTVTVNGHLEQVTSTHMINVLRDAVGAIGEVKLGIKKEDVGMHLIRLGAAMAMYLGECPVFMIMLIG